MKKGIILDMDGTLWDSAENVAKSWNEAIAAYNGYEKTLTTEDIQGVMGKTMDEIADILFADLSMEDRTELLHTCCEIENDYLREHGGILYEGVRETLAKLREKGYHLSIVSNCQAGYIEAFLDYYQLWDAIDDKQCYGDNLLSKTENICLVADRNGLDEIVYVGDTQGDYRASRAAGAHFIHTAYGFGRIDADVPVIHTFLELAEMDMDAVYAGK